MFLAAALLHCVTRHADDAVFVAVCKAGLGAGDGSGGLRVQDSCAACTS